jgi:hypothetical protein
MSHVGLHENSWPKQLPFGRHAIGHRQLPREQLGGLITGEFDRSFQQNFRGIFRRELSVAR